MNSVYTAPMDTGMRREAIGGALMLLLMLAVAVYLFTITGERDCEQLNHEVFVGELDPNSLPLECR